MRVRSLCKASVTTHRVQGWRRTDHRVEPTRTTSPKSIRRAPMPHHQQGLHVCGKVEESTDERGGGAAKFERSRHAQSHLHELRRRAR